MDKASIKKEVKKFKTMLQRKNKFNPDKESILNFVHGSTDKLVLSLVELGVQSCFDVKERINELVGC